MARNISSVFRFMQIKLYQMGFHQNPTSRGKSKIKYDIKRFSQGINQIFTGILIFVLSSLVQNICQYRIWFWNYSKFSLEGFDPGFENSRELPLNYPLEAQMSSKRGKSMLNNFPNNFLNFYRS